MAEIQQEIEMTGCNQCGKSLGDFEMDYCERCNLQIERQENDFDMTRKIISKLIYGSVSKTDLKLLHEIMFGIAELNYRCVFEINQTELASKLDWKQGNISRSLKKLVESGLLLKEENKYKFGISEII